MKIDLSNRTAGGYHLQVVMEKGIANKKIMVE